MFYRVAHMPFNRGGRPGSGAGSDEYVRVRLPNKAKGEVFGLADQLLGASRIKVLGADGKARMGRIPGKLRKRMWIRQGDLLIIKPWEFQDAKADIVWRYTKTQAISLAKKRLLPEVINVF
jgi:translation initiation factor 1A